MFELRRGKVMNRAARVAGKASAGLVLCSSLAWRYACEEAAVVSKGVCAGEGHAGGGRSFKFKKFYK